MDIFEEMERDARATISTAPDISAASKLAELGEEVVRLQDWILKAEDLVSQRKSRLNDIFFRDLVDAMDACHQDVMGLPGSNADIKVEDYYKAGIPNPDTGKTDEEKLEKAVMREMALRWLGVNAPGLVTTDITISLPKGSTETARQIREDLIARYAQPNDPDLVPVNPERIQIVEGVHWGALTSFVKEQVRDHHRETVAVAPRTGNIEELEALPLDILGATIGRVAKIVKRKKK